MKVVSFYSLVGTLQCAVVSFAVERNLSAWKLKLDLKLLLIISTAIFGRVIRARVQIWCSQAKGPFYVPMFKPFAILYACFFAVCFFANSHHYGSIIGAFIVGIGYYSLMWGQIREGKARDDHDNRNGDSRGNKVPLLQEETQV
ncbi:WAT1-related protein At1g60050 [Syzygium oleosum]|uniref:WAT1-related protein At1g60050 n=1 Tax=Syzygium oleosum TaxID=219896 RepID=UPI0024BA4716|nr:WAT1-related protein At1g60050 [Syzygium oleosum]